MLFDTHTVFLYVCVCTLCAYSVCVCDSHTLTHTHTRTEFSRFIIICFIWKVSLSPDKGRQDWAIRSVALQGKRLEGTTAAPMAKPHKSYHKNWGGRRWSDWDFGDETIDWVREMWTVDWGLGYSCSRHRRHRSWTWRRRNWIPRIPLCTSGLYSVGTSERALLRKVSKTCFITFCRALKAICKLHGTKFTILKCITINWEYFEFICIDLDVQTLEPVKYFWEVIP